MGSGSAPAPATAPASVSPTSHSLLIRDGARETTVLVPPGDTLLDAARAAGISLEFSCTVGGCGTCALRLVDGDVELDEPNALTADERASGLILPCVSRPRSPCTIEVP